MKKLIFIFVSLLMILKLHAAESVLELWKTIDDETQKPKSIVCLYEKDKQLYGRILAVFDLETGKIIDTIATQKRIAENVKGKPKTCGLDFIWGLKENKNEWSGGEIMDPAKGKVYNCVIWFDEKENKLIVRGKILFIGRNQKWQRLSKDELPKDLIIDSSTFEPKIIK